jgi:hypothetical protein
VITSHWVAELTKLDLLNAIQEIAAARTKPKITIICTRGLFDK